MFEKSEQNENNISVSAHVILFAFLIQLMSRYMQRHHMVCVYMASLLHT